MNTRLLPNNDPDLQLARRIGNYLEGRLELDYAEDSLIKPILDYKRERKKELSASVITDSAAIWKKIEKEIKPGKKETRIHQLGSTKTKAIWATAASLLIAAFIGIYYYTTQQPEMIASSAQQIQTVVLDDGSKVTLRPHSSIYVLSGNANEHNYKLEGEAYFEVVSNPERTFSVKAGNAKVTVLGTKFDLSTWGNQIQVYLEEGLISFENVTNNISVTLNPGESAEIDDDSINTGLSDVSEFTDWMNRELVFKNKTARYVFNELEQEFNFTISAPDSVLNTTLSGGLSLANAQQSLDDLSLVLDGKFVKEGEKRYKFVPN